MYVFFLTGKNFVLDKFLEKVKLIDFGAAMSIEVS